jgi:probable HAF family extracellular repeat protein
VKTIINATLATVLILQCVSTARAQQYKVVDLGTLPGGTSSQATAINGRGEVVGVSSVPQGMHAFLWSRGDGMQDLGTLPGGGTYSYAAGINLGGNVAGTSDFAQPFMGNTHAFVWNESSGMHDLGTLGCPNITGANGINAFSEVVGVSTIAPCPGGGQYRAFIAFFATPSGTMQSLGTLPGGSFSIGLAINFFGDAVGYAGCSPCSYGAIHAFLWTKKDGMKDLGTFPGGTSSEARGINSFDFVVGGSNFQTGGVLQSEHAAIWSKTGELTDLGVLPGGNSSIAFGINDRNKVIGYGNYANGYSSGIHAFIWSKETGMQDLNELIPSNSNWVLTAAQAINQRGQIVGYGTVNQQTHAFLLTPHGHGDSGEAKEEGDE